MKNTLKIFDYSGSRIQFDKIDGRIMANATQMGAAFGKRPESWLRTDRTMSYINAILKVKKCALENIVQVKQGRHNGGTWIDEKLVLDFARWLDPEFAIWCDEKIAELLRTGTATISHVRPSGDSFLDGLTQLYNRWKINEDKVPHTHFSMLGEVQARVLMTLKSRGFDLAVDCLPDGSLGLGFCKYLREKRGIDTNALPTYMHEFTDGRQPRPVKMYPNEYYADLQAFANEVWIEGHGAKYFNTKMLA